MGIPNNRVISLFRNHPNYKGLNSGWNFPDLNSTMHLSSPQYLSSLPGAHRRNNRFHPPEDDYLAKQDGIRLRTCPRIPVAFSSNIYWRCDYAVNSNAVQSTCGALNDISSTNPRLASHVNILTLRGQTGDLRRWAFTHPNFVACLALMSQSGDRYPRLSDLRMHLTTQIWYAHRLEAIELPSIGLLIDLKTRWVMTSCLTSVEFRHLYNVPIVLFDT